MHFTLKVTEAVPQRYVLLKSPYEIHNTDMACSAKQGARGKKGTVRWRRGPLTYLACYFAWASCRCPVFNFYLTGLRFFDSIIKSLILHEATVDANHHCWPVVNYQKGQFVVPQLWWHGRQLAVLYANWHDAGSPKR